MGAVNLVLASLVFTGADLDRVRSEQLGQLARYLERIEARARTNAGGTKTWSAHADSLYDPTCDSSAFGTAVLRGADGRELARRGEVRRFDRSLVSLLGLELERDLPGPTGGIATLTVAGNPQHVLARLLLLGQILAVLGTAAAAITFSRAKRIQRRYSGQLLGLVQTANAVSMRKDYSIRAITKGDEEFRILADTFNHMIAQISLQQEQLRREVERAESAKTAKAQFLATMSHEIRTPINGIIGVAELLRDTELDTEQTDFVRTINDSADNLLRIINDVLNYSKIEAGHIEIDSSTFSLGEVLDGCLDTVATLSGNKSVEVLCDVRPEVPDGLQGDPTRIRQVLLNLLTNALKFTDEGEVTLRVTPESRGWLRFEVQDTGIGIPEDRIERLFKSFSQVDSSNRRKYEGSGLGLVISKQIVEAMGGSMFVRTKQEAGSTFGFRIKLPVVDLEDEGEDDMAPRGLRILAAEPSATSLEMLTKHLRVGNAVATESTGAGARRALLEAREQGRGYDVCLVHSSLMPELLDGPETLPGMPLIVTHPASEPSRLLDIPWPGPTGTLARPIRKNSLYWCLSRLLQDAAHPAAPLPSSPSSEPLGEAEAFELSRLRVLVAEDNPVNQTIVSRFLEKLGVRTTLVANGERAVQEVRERAYDLILMDVQMPVMDGVAAVREIRAAEREGQHHNIAALTANVLAEDRDYYLETGFDFHLGKPLRFGSLRSFLLDFVVDGAAAHRIPAAGQDAEPAPLDVCLGRQVSTGG